MDQLQPGVTSSSSATTSTSTSNLASNSSVIVQQSGISVGSAQINPGPSSNNPSELESLGSILLASSSQGPGPLSSTSSSGIVSPPAELGQSRVTTTQQLGTPTGAGASSGQSPVLSPPGKIFGRNFNGTMVATSSPNNEAELQLYRVLQRASLLMYYDTLLEMGGDDVQQLCDAGEEEFLEIMALVGMASKPLHVRRLQKALQEWVNNPSLFQSPLPNIDSSRPLYSPEPSASSRSPFSNPLPSVYSPVCPTSSSLVASSTSNITSLSSLASNLGSHHLSSGSIQLTPTLTDSQISRLVASAERLSSRHSSRLSQLEPRPQNSKKRSSKELEQVMTISENDPRRMDEIRKYAAIYGRFDCKRRPEKPLTLHEVCVNEAAAQICKIVPALLTRRDELFPLARQVVRDSGFGHSAGIARFAMSSSGSHHHQMQQITRSDDHDPNSSLPKRSRISGGHSDPGLGRHPTDMSPMMQDHNNGKEYPEHRDKILSLYQRIGKSFDFTDASKFSYNSFSRSEFDDNDSRYSFSNSNSPPMQNNITCGDNESETMNLSSSMDPNNHNNSSSEMNCEKLDETRDLLPLSPDSHSEGGPMQIISAAGGQIIAVTNPYLALSPALGDPTLSVKREVISPSDLS